MNFLIGIEFFAQLVNLNDLIVYKNRVILYIKSYHPIIEIVVNI